MNHFEFKYMSNKNVIDIDDFNVNAKIGPFIKRNFPTQNIVNYYYLQQSTVHTFHMIYTDEKGKRKKTAFLATPGEPGIQNLNYYMNEKFPQKSLNHLNEKDAFAAMQMANPKKVAIIVMFVLMNLILGLTLLSALRHSMDFGFTNAKVEDIIAGKDLGTRNVNVEGRTLNYGIEETTTNTRNGIETGKSHTTFVPLVSEDWQEGDPIKVLIEFKEMTDAQYDAALEMKDFMGVIRNIGFEGVTDKQLSYFDEQYSITFPEKPILIEYTNAEHNDIYAPCVLGGLNLVMLIIALIVWIKNKK